jgi:2-oxoglutarate dehydrogenase E2 component (dihydrolipoamide succinyltransferase)
MSNSIYSTPLILKLAKKLGVDLSSMIGTGLNGRIRKVDLVSPGKSKITSVQQHVNNNIYLTPLIKKYAALKNVDLSNIKGSGFSGRIRRSDIDKNQGITPPAVVKATIPRSENRIEYDLMRDLATMAQLSTTLEIDFTNVLNQIKGNTQEKLVPIAYLIRSAILGIQEMPIINASLSDDLTQIKYHAEVNFSYEDELVKYSSNSIIEDADNYNLLGVTRLIKDFRNEPKQSAKNPTFGIQDQSNTEILFSTPIVKSPTSALLSLGKIQKRPVSADNPEGSTSIAIRSIAYVTLSYDHRIIDGADAARFLSFVKQQIENKELN